MTVDVTLLALFCFAFGFLLMVVEIFHPGFGIFGIFGGILLIVGIILKATSLLDALVMFIVILAILTVITNMIFIPIFGIIGAAIANMLSVSTYFLLEVILIWKKFRSQPFVRNTVVSILISIIIFFAFKEIQNLVMNLFNLNLTNSFSVIILIAVRSTVVGLIFIFIFWKLKLSEEFNAIISKSFEIIKTKFSF